MGRPHLIIVFKTYYDSRGSHNEIYEKGAEKWF